jgi:putative protease
MQANTVERIGEKLWRVRPNESIRDLPGLKPGLAINRNRDHAWEQALMKKSAERKIPV